MTATSFHRLTAPLLALLVLTAGTSGCTSGPSPEDDSAYLTEIAELRTTKDQQFRADVDPVPADKRDVFLPLKYYDIDPSYSVPASLKLAEERPVFEMPTSTGKLRRMMRVGVLEFTLQGQPMSLGAFVEDGTPEIVELFVPFADTTTGTETYSAGRYLDLRPTTTGYYMVDFNRAYNPYCAYNSAYDCPFPPASNRLKVAIKAGEKTPAT